ncbi:MAG: segregation and condensation protein A [Bradymonadia bacterium]|jgi:segregation and condensation protein A
MTQIPANHGAEFRFELGEFEGPLDLLLHLIRKHEIDVFDIPISFITDKYLRYIEAMQILDLAIAGEYLVMAATLLHIKSKTLLPRPEVDDDEEGLESQIDPRAELVRRLLVYQRYRDVAEHLGGREMEGNDVFRRPSRARGYSADAGPADVVPVDLFHLMDAFRKVMEDAPPEAMHEVTEEQMSIRDAILAIAEHLVESPRATLLELVYLTGPEPARLQIVVTFMAVLEMAKLRLVRVFQTRLSTTDTFIERAVIDPDELTQKIAGLLPDE